MGDGGRGKSARPEGKEVIGVELKKSEVIRSSVCQAVALCCVDLDGA